MKQARWDSRDTGRLRRIGQRKRIIDAARSEAPAERSAGPLARLVSQVLLATLIFVSVFAVFFAWLTSLAWALTAAIVATGLTRGAVEWAAASDRGRRAERRRVQRLLRETARRVEVAGPDDFLASLTRCLGRLGYECPQLQPGFGSGGEGMVIASNGDRRIAIYHIVDGSAVLDSDAVIIAASELARIDCARHFFATTGEFTPAAYQRAERVGITLIDRYELVGLFAADEAQAARIGSTPGSADQDRGPRWRGDPDSVSGCLEANQRRITGHWRVALMLAAIALLSSGRIQLYLLALVAANTVGLVYRQWLNFRLLEATGGALPDSEASGSAANRE